MDKKQAVPEFSVEDYDPAPDQELICVICRGVLRNPVECRCRHIFCDYCIRTWLRSCSSCPVCRRKVSVGISPLAPAHPAILNMLGRLRVKCRNPGCDTRVAVESYTSHAEECAQREVSCPNAPCSFTCVQRDLAPHLDGLCSFRKVTCTLGCSLDLLAKDVSEHSCIDALKQKLAEMKSERDHHQREAQDRVRALGRVGAALQSVSRALTSLQSTVGDLVSRVENASALVVSSGSGEARRSRPSANGDSAANTSIGLLFGTRTAMLLDSINSDSDPEWTASLASEDEDEDSYVDILG